MATTEKRANPSTEQESAAPESHAAVEFGREVCGSLEIAEQREWLVTNGIGGYASGTVSGDVTRCYHGVLVAALHPPVGRTQLVAKLEETVGYDGSEFALATNRWLSGAVEPQGYLNIESFCLLSATARFEPRHDWYRNFLLPQETARGLDDREDYLFAAAASVELARSQSVTLVFTTDPQAELDGARTLSEQVKHERGFYSKWMENGAVAAAVAPAWIRQLILAADQFIVKRPLPAESEGRSVIAGYHWFGDWGRDTMIALPGLTLATRRPEIAREILFALARYVDGGMLPNNFPDAGGVPQYNTADAALWYFEAVRQYFEATKDAEGILKLYPVLTQITSAHLHGTRYHIHVDAADGLLYAGEEGVQLTWMDAKVGDWVVTPRIGKPVEINVLWYNALKTMA